MVLFSSLSLAQTQQVKGQQQEKARPKKPIPTYTDDDLARLAEERRRRETNNEGVAAEPSGPKPGTARPEAGHDVPPPPGPVARTAVILDDRSGRLPPPARQAAEAFAGRMVAFYGAPVDGAVTIPLHYCDTQECFTDYMQRNYKGIMRMGRIAGYYDRTRKEIFVGSSPTYFETLVHEMNHFIIARVLPRAPRWLDEGLSEYFETATTDPKGVGPEYGHRRRALRAWLAKGMDPGLRELLGMNPLDVG